MKKLKSEKKYNPNAKPILLTFKVNAKEMHEIMKNYLAYTGGNRSEWLRRAAVNWKPTKKDLEK